MREACLYEGICADIKRLIAAGSLQPGERIFSLSQLRDSYQVSHITALRAMRELIGENIVEPRKGKGYFVREGGRVSQGTIACVTRPFRPATLHDNYFNDVNQAIQRECMRRKINVLSPYCGYDLGDHFNEGEARKTIVGQIIGLCDKVDGLLLDERIGDALVRELRRKTNKPMVTVGRRGRAGIDSICPDNLDGARGVAELCLKMNYKLFLVGKCQSGCCDNFDARTAGFLSALRANHVPEDRLFRFDFNLAPYEETLAALEGRLGKLKTMIFSPMDCFARWLADALAEKGAVLGREVGVTGFDGIGYSDFKRPHVATVDVRPSLIGAKAVEVLVDRIEGRSMEPPGVHVVPSVFKMGDTI